MTPITGLARLLGTNATGTFQAQAAQITPPVSATGIGLAQLGTPATPLTGQSVDNLLLVPFGTTTAGNTFDLRVTGWKQTKNGLWVPLSFCRVTCTLANLPGLSGQDVLNTELFCDTLALVKGNNNVSVELLGPADGTGACLLVDAKGCHLLTVTFNLGTASGANALWAGV